jgi:hypothetical protein
MGNKDGPVRHGAVSPGPCRLPALLSRVLSTISRGGGRIWPGLVAVFLAASSASGQADILEHWTADYLRSGWAPSWQVLETDSMVPMDGNYRVALSSEFERLSLGNGSVLGQGHSWVRFQQPLGSSLHVLRAGVRQDTRSISSHGQEPFLKTPFALALDLGSEFRWDAGSFGDVALSLVGAWDRGPAWSIGLLSSSTVHRFQVRRWRNHTRPVTLAFPSDSVTHAAVENAVDGLLVEASVGYSLGVIRPSVGLSFETYDSRQESIDRETFLTLSPAGSLERIDLSFSIEAGPAGVGVKHRRQEGDLDGKFQRHGAQAGKLFFGQSRFTQWALELWRKASGGRWSFQIGVDESDVAMSARLETWPFVRLWEQLGATAFRYRGSFSGRAQWVRFEKTAGRQSWGGLSWAASAGRYRLETSQEDWLVTSFGFGRAEQDSTASSIDPAVFLGIEASKSFRVTSGDLRLLISGGLPVYADTKERPVDRVGLPGEIRLRVSWWY